MQLDGALDRIDCARELDKQTIASGADNVSIELGDLGLHYPSPQLLETGQRTRLVGRHEPRIASYIGG